MAAAQKLASSFDLDEKKRKRMLSNRESVRRSRARKQKQKEDLSNEESAMQKENSQFPEKIKVIEEQFTELECSNNELSAQKMELNSRINSLDMVLQNMGQAMGYGVHIPETTDPLIQPWLQPPFPTAYNPDI
ncbi:hypothetical protein V6N13_093465 [Hibiscus sabdariffa]|uniref:BZIP domain-containing protein n=1 Tax=Hibiscus sabdariffa TaxID=183260 RepID=A0ABR2BRI2_9ROSI